MAANLHIDTKNKVSAAVSATNVGTAGKDIEELRDEFAKLLTQMAQGVNAQGATNDQSLMAWMDSAKVKIKAAKEQEPKKKDMDLEPDCNLPVPIRPEVCPAPPKQAKNESNHEEVVSEDKADGEELVEGQEQAEVVPVESEEITGNENVEAIPVTVSNVPVVEPKMIKCDFGATEAESKPAEEENQPDILPDAQQEQLPGELVAKDQTTKSNKAENSKVAVNIEKPAANEIVADPAASPTDQMITAATASDKSNDSAAKNTKQDNGLHLGQLFRVETPVQNTGKEELQSLIAQRLASIVANVPSLSGSKSENGGLLTKSMSINSNGIMAGDAMSGSKASSTADSKSSRMLTRSQLTRMMEKVENALQDAARSKDGKTISVRINPEEFGTIKVDVSLRESKLHARLTPENQQILTVLRERAPELQQMLRKLGLDVDSVSVTVTSDSFAGLSKEWEDSSSQFGWGSKQNNPGGRGGASSEILTGAEALTGNSKLINDHWVA